MIKIVLKDSGDAYTFLFSARPILNSVSDVLSNIIHERQAKKERDAEEQEKAPASVPATSVLSSAESSSATTPSAAKKKKARQGKQNYDAHLDTKKLLRDLSLQQSVVDSNRDLQKMFEEAVMKGGLSHEDFWSTRIDILRAHVLETSQKRGPYNVLSTIKHSTNSENQQTLTLSSETLQDIREQYPIVQQAFRDNVPPMEENVFWVEFFSSKLYRRLRGDKVKPSDPTNAVLDKYLDYLNSSEKSKQAALLSRKRKLGEDGPGGSSNNGNTGNGNDDDKADEVEVPFFINIEGNEENDPQKMGNRPDYTMRSGAEGPSALTLLKSMNWLSQRMVYGQDGVSNESSENGRAPHGQTVPMHDRDESHLMDELRIRGLEVDKAPEYMRLQVKTADPDALRAGDGLSVDLPMDISENGAIMSAGSVPIAATSSASPPPSQPVLGYEESMAYMQRNVTGAVDLQEVASTPVHADAIKRVQKHITRTIKIRSKEAGGNRTREEREVESQVQAKALVVHSTSIEFLRHFWMHFLSGDPAQAVAIRELVAGLKKSLERINQLEKQEEKNPNYQLIIASLGPLVNSITKALETYRAAIVAQQQRASAAAASNGASTASPSNGTPNI